MDKYISLSDALDVLAQFQDAVENGEQFYSQGRKMMCTLPSITKAGPIRCRDCQHYSGCEDYCLFHNRVTYHDCFCNYAMRKNHE